MNWKGLACVAAMAALACGSAAKGSDIQQPDSSVGGSQFVNPQLFDDMTTMPAAPPASPAAASAPAAPGGPPPTPAMYFLGKTPVGDWMTNNGFSITGFAELGYFYDTNNPTLGGPFPANFVTFPGAYSNRFLLDQIDLTLAKTIDTTKKWDWGFLFENGYGIDDSYIHSHGMLDNRAPGNPNNQYDIIQANVSLLAPVGTGLTVVAGKFIALIGQEVINPTGNAFYTHSYSFFYGDPATNTGVLASYTFPKLITGNDWTATAGFTEGWNQSLRDNNGAIDFLGQFKGKFGSNLSFLTNLEVGPEAAGDNSDYWTSFEAIPSLAVSDQLTVTGDFIYVDYPHGATDGGVSAQWYGVAGYASYVLNSMFTINARAEWYRDQGAFTTGTSANYYELTFGTQIHPFPDNDILRWLQVRPEIRGDLSDHAVYAGDFSQLSAAVDVIMQF
jgi:Putative beta-barrel porin-2, OmpL-like. bbp2